MGMPCAPGCQCGRHTVVRAPCPNDCMCNKHFRTRRHNERIGKAVARTYELKRQP